MHLWKLFYFNKILDCCLSKQLYQDNIQFPLKYCHKTEMLGTINIQANIRLFYKHYTATIKILITFK